MALEGLFTGLVVVFFLEPGRFLLHPIQGDVQVRERADVVVVDGACFDQAALEIEQAHLRILQMVLV